MKMRRSFLVAAVLLAQAGVASAGQNWADTAGTDPAFAASKAICLKAKAVKLPKPEGKAPADDCNSSDLLYGVGQPADPVAARACAQRKFAGDNDNPLTGAGALATIYANGQGVTRNIDLAIAYACRIDGAPAEVDGWVKHIASLRTAKPGAKPFDLCDDATSGMMEGACAARTGALADAARTGEIKTLTAKLDGPARAAFDKLQAAEKTFTQSSADNEVDVSGTGRGAFIVESQQKHDDAFVATLRDLLGGKLGEASAPTRTDADKRLNDAYTKLMALKDTSSLGTVTKKGVRETQRLWLGYRDAFVAFAKTLAAPGAAAADGVTTRLTDQRTKDFSDLLGL